MTTDKYQELMERNEALDIQFTDLMARFKTAQECEFKNMSQSDLMILLAECQECQIELRKLGAESEKYRMSLRTAMPELPEVKLYFSLL